MEVYTIQLGQWRKAKALGIQLLDTTVRTGDAIFAPSWGMVLASKEGRLSHDDYTKEYRRMMMTSFRERSERWREVIRGEPVALACYCAPGEFCHRHLLVGFFEEICASRGIPFLNHGEIT